MLKCLYFHNKNGNRNRRPPPSPSPSFKGQDQTAANSKSDADEIKVEPASSSPNPIDIYPQKPSNLRVFTFAELRIATKNFSKGLRLGEGGFGSVYKGFLKNPEDPEDKTEVAVKRLTKKGLQGHKEWIAEVHFLGLVEHPNLVKLVGYCAEDDARGLQLLLVYEFMPNKSLEDHLFSRELPVLPWATRLKIALGAAHGLANLHEELNIQLVGTAGYAAPEYIQTGHVSSKSDVWSFGVVLYELLTGRRAMDNRLPKNEQKLLEWVKPYISESKRFRLILDPRLRGQYSLKEAHRIASLAHRCLVKQPKARPKMSEVVNELKNIIGASKSGSPQSVVAIPSAERDTEDFNEEPLKESVSSKSPIFLLKTMFNRMSK